MRTANGRSSLLFAIRSSVTIATQAPALLTTGLSQPWRVVVLSVSTLAYSSSLSQSHIHSWSRPIFTEVRGGCRVLCMRLAARTTVRSDRLIGRCDVTFFVSGLRAPARTPERRIVVPGWSKAVWSCAEAREPSPFARVESALCFCVCLGDSRSVDATSRPCTRLRLTLCSALADVFGRNQVVEHVAHSRRG
jgi:hypothetical protein